MDTATDGAVLERLPLTQNPAHTEPENPGHGVIELGRLTADGARPAGPPPLRAGTGTAIEVERMVNGTGLIGLAGRQLNVGCELAGQRVTLRMDGTQMTVISHDGTLLRTLPCPVPPQDRH